MSDRKELPRRNDGTYSTNSNRRLNVSSPINIFMGELLVKLHTKLGRQDEGVNLARDAMIEADDLAVSKLFDELPEVPGSSSPSAERQLSNSMGQQHNRELRQMTRGAVQQNQREGRSAIIARNLEEMLYKASDAAKDVTKHCGRKLKFPNPENVVLYKFLKAVGRVHILGSDSGLPQTYKGFSRSDKFDQRTYVNAVASAINNPVRRVKGVNNRLKHNTSTIINDFLNPANRELAKAIGPEQSGRIRGTTKRSIQEGLGALSTEISRG